VFSKDGEQVAFNLGWQCSERNRFYVNASERETVATHPGVVVSCAVLLTSDDRYIAFERCGENAGIFLVPSLGGADRRLGKAIAATVLAGRRRQLLVFSDKSSPDASFALFLMSATICSRIN